MTSFPKDAVHNTLCSLQTDLTLFTLKKLCLHSWERRNFSDGYVVFVGGISWPSDESVLCPTK